MTTETDEQYVAVLQIALATLLYRNHFVHNDMLHISRGEYENGPARYSLYVSRNGDQIEVSLVDPGNDT